jgi:hypothetical protein
MREYVTECGFCSLLAHTQAYSGSLSIEGEEQLVPWPEAHTDIRIM